MCLAAAPRHSTQSRKILLIVGVLIAGGLGCTSVSPPKAGLLGDAAVGGAVASGGRDGGGGGAGGDAAGLPRDGKIVTDVAGAADVPASGGGTGGAGGSGGGGGNDASAGNSGGAVGNDASAGSGGGLGGSTGSGGGVVGSDASAGSSGTGGISAGSSGSGGGSAGNIGGGSAGNTGVGGGSAGNTGVGGGSAGSGGSGGAPDAAPDVRIVDASGTCSVDNECSAATPLCLGNRCAKCSSDTDCVGRAGPACASSGLCVGCTADKYCTGTAGRCDTATNQCVGCTKRSDCAGACLTCSASGVCTAVKGQADSDSSRCAGTCDSTGACKATQGQTCKANSDCAGGLPCVDGFCCNIACNGSCQACDLPASPGTCTTQGLNATPRHAACVTANSTCAGHCDGTSASCSYPTSSTSCGSTCTGSTLTPKACDSAGACVSGTAKPCDYSLVCASSGTACKPGPCTADSDCITGDYCASGTCTPKLAPGTGCSTANQCTSANCVGGICCNTACGQCHSCATGTCTAVTDLTSCGTGSVCVGGSCIVCAQGSSCQPTNPCQTGTFSCASGTSQCVANGSRQGGTSCGSGQVCSGGNCQTGCWIGGNFLATGTTNGANTCQICTPTTSTTGWSNNNGASVGCGTCGGTATCTGGAAGPCSKTAVYIYQDVDGDGYGNPNVKSTDPVCSVLPGWVTQAGDCDDNDYTDKPGTTECENYDPNILTTCSSSGTWVTSTCANGCAGGQCRIYPFPTMDVAGTVSCSNIQCPTSQGCSFGGGWSGGPACGTPFKAYHATCDGQNDCPAGQQCCWLFSGGSDGGVGCFPNGTCPFFGMGSNAYLICDNSPGSCPAGSTCTMLAPYSTYYCAPN